MVEAVSLLKEGKVAVTPNYGWNELRIEATVITKEGTGIAYILKEHSNIAYIEVDGEAKFEELERKDEVDNLRTFQQLTDFIELIEGDIFLVNGKSPKTKIEDAIKTNHKASLIAERRLSESHMENVGFTIRNSVEDTCVNWAKEKVSLAVEGRMAGFNIRVMTCAGSGNMGLVVTLPLITMAWWKLKRRYPKYNIKWDSAIEEIQGAPEDWEKLVRAVGLAYLITSYVSAFSARLSALCGCGFKAGMGAAAGIVYYITPMWDRDRVRIIGQAINNMAEGIVGMICDGAKRGCALKAAMATGAAVESALLARLGLLHSNGIVNEDAMITLRHVGEISKATEGIDMKIIELLQDTPPSYRN